jgi:hypothetical protein
MQIATIRGTHLSAELGKRLNSSSGHFTSRAPLFEASYLFAARLSNYGILFPESPFSQLRKANKNLKEK